MDIYKILKFNAFIKSHRIKFFGLWLLSILDKRYLAIQFDPVLACNLRCKMCYFTDDAYVRANMKGMFKEEDLEALAKVNFKNALKLQIGCGAEPTLFKHNTKLIEIAKKHRVPYISMVTNGNLLDKKDIADFANAGLNEFILSMHGVTQETYEDLMDKGVYEKFHEVLQNITEQKKQNPGLKLRINYTFNEDNFHQLKDFFTVYGHYEIDIIQLRPIDKIGETTYANFSLKAIEKDYAEVSGFMKNESARRGITLLFPKTILREENQSLIVNTGNNSSYLLPYTYCYVSPKFYWKDDFNWKEETFADWKRRNRWNSLLFRNIFVSKRNLEKPNRNMLNYSVELN
ncbi:radical SAM protein [Flavobacterium silvisoli]|uniref:Radical SAM protein n=1 Tax=Flavobacterium silvisoli TaxID=2529433 RepID=A0A4Q9Z4D6_9FLAO|nr:radical SAM protein [Flavobacterium silvisoli]TBX71305.1 radical SAM protein [Flavobacterium silvisoli]